MVFDKEAAPRTRPAFMRWYTAQTEWTEEHSYDDPSVTTPALESWLQEIRQTFPDLNSPDATADTELYWTDYSIGNHVIYIAFGWSVAGEAYETVYRLAAKHQVGFFDVSGGTPPAILLPQDGILKPLTERVTPVQVLRKPWWKVW